VLKTVLDDAVVCVTQPDHARVSGYLAAHWGNAAFARPEQLTAADEPEALRAEILLAVAEHDNGWWEWEAAPSLAPEDGLPLDLSEVQRDPGFGLERWRLGVARFAEQHPYAALLIARHAVSLYLPRVDPTGDRSPWYPLFVHRPPPRAEGQEHATLARFLTNMEATAAVLRRRLVDTGRAGWSEPAQVAAHARLLQLLDALSLALCSRLIPGDDGSREGFGRDPLTLPGVPRRHGDDQVEMRLYPVGPDRIALAPWPLDGDALEVPIVEKRFPPLTEPPPPGRWHAIPFRTRNVHLFGG
jgi:hypothetical protein